MMPIRQLQKITFALLSFWFAVGLNAQPATTGIPGKQHTAFVIASVDQNCNVIWQYETRVKTPPSHGKAGAGFVIPLPYSERCPGPYPFAAASYAWDINDAALTDQFYIDVKYPDDKSPTGEIWLPTLLHVKRLHLSIENVDLKTGLASILLHAGDDAYGTVDLEFEGESGARTKLVGTVIYKGSTNPVPVIIDRPKLRKDNYVKVRATWNATIFRLDGQTIQQVIAGDYSPAQPLQVKGITQYTQYNVPVEEKCSGTKVKRWIVDSLSSCTFKEGELKKEFASQTRVNGTGRSSEFGLLKIASATRVFKDCAGKAPPGATSENTFLQVATVTGACNTVLKPNVSNAEYKPQKVKADCNATHTLVNSDNSNFGGREVDDLCPVCNLTKPGTEYHVDNFASFEACSGRDAVDLGNYWTYKAP